MKKCAVVLVAIAAIVVVVEAIVALESSLVLAVVREGVTARIVGIIREAIEGMLPKTRLGERMAARLKVYAGPTHPHAAQDPEPLSFER